MPSVSAVSTLYEDEHLLAVDKPAGVVVHPAYKNPDGTLLDALRASRSWPPGGRPSIVGRLDKLTSGIVLVAKTAEIHAAMQRTMASPDSVKEYAAIAYGRSDRDHGDIAFGLAVSAADRRVVLASDTEGAPSLTRFEVASRADAPDVGLLRLRCFLVTGRRHQIRVHLAARGWPIVGDPKYGERGWERIRERGLAEALRMFPRQALHAHIVSFVHPVLGVRISVTAPIPADMRALMREARLLQ